MSYELQKRFQFSHKWGDDIFTATVSGDTVAVSWVDGSSRTFMTQTYSTSMVEGFIKDGTWKVHGEVPVSNPCAELLDREYDFPELLPEVNIKLDTAPRKWGRVTGDNFELIDNGDGSGYDDDEGVTLGYLRQVAKDIGAVIEIDADFYTVRVADVTFVATDGVGLVKLIDAYKTLDAASK